MSNDNEKRIQEIDIELQKVEVKIDQLELMPDRDQYMDEYIELKEKFNSLLKERKALKPKNEKIWDKIPIWMYIYCVFQIIILGIPYVSQIIWINFSNWIITIFETQLDKLAYAPQFAFTTVLILIIYSLPIINLFISWILYVNVVHKPFEKKVFKIIWIVQAVLTLIVGTILFIQIILPTL